MAQNCGFTYLLLRVFSYNLRCG